MKPWKIISGILSMLLSVVIVAFSLLHIVGTTVSPSHTMGFFGLLAAFMLFLAGLISICTCAGYLGGNIATTIFYFLTVVLSFARISSYPYLLISGIWSVICLIIVFIFCFCSKKKSAAVPNVNVYVQQPQGGVYYPPQQNVQNGQYYQPPQQPQNGQYYRPPQQQYPQQPPQGGQYPPRSGQ